MTAHTTRSPPPPALNLFVERAARVPILDYDQGWSATATIRSLQHPNLSFECDMVIDTGCSVGPLALPLRKVQQLQLQEERTDMVMTASGVGFVQFYYPVKVEMVDLNGKMHSAIMEPLVTPAGAILRTGVPVTGVAPLPLEHSIRISPVKLPLPSERKDLSVPLLGSVGLTLLGFGLDP